MSDQEELWQGYDEQGEQTGSLTKDDARVGALHAASHVWIWRHRNNAVEILVQRRAGDKATWANHLDISAAGHIDAGETPLATALREANEEIGLTIHSERLYLINVYRTQLEASIKDTRIIENEFQFIYIYEFTGDNSEFTFQDDEVGGTYWLSVDEFHKTIEGLSADAMVPHGETYFRILLEGIHRHAQR